MKALLKICSATFLMAVTAACVAQENLGVAQYTPDNQLLYPSNLHEWIQAGASLGSEYNDKPFDPQSPGTIGVVQMEPKAYAYFMEHSTYAEGTMFLLSFYQAEGKSNPQLPGFVQGDLLQQEIHVLDKTKFSDGHGFFLYRGQTVSSAVIPAPNECTTCHNEHGAFAGTFTQFYPALRAKLGNK